MEWTAERIKIGEELVLAIFRGQADLCENLCRQNPWIIHHDQTWQTSKPSWLRVPARKGDIATISKLLELGFSVNALNGKEESTALVSAVEGGHYQLAVYLLEQGADPNLSRPMISALSPRKSPEIQLKFARLLLDHGCEINKVYPLYGDIAKGFTALDRASDPDVIALLRSMGAENVAG